MSVPVSSSSNSARSFARASRNAAKPPCASIIDLVKRPKSRPVISSVLFSLSPIRSVRIVPSSRASSTFGAWRLPSALSRARRWAPERAIAGPPDLELDFGQTLVGVPGHQFVAAGRDGIHARRAMVEREADRIEQRRLARAGKARDGEQAAVLERRPREVDLPFALERAEIAQAQAEDLHAAPAPAFALFATSRDDFTVERHQAVAQRIVERLAFEAACEDVVGRQFVEGFPRFAVEARRRRGALAPDAQYLDRQALGQYVDARLEVAQVIVGRHHDFEPDGTALGCLLRGRANLAGQLGERASDRDERLGKRGTRSGVTATSTPPQNRRAAFPCLAGLRRNSAGSANRYSGSARGRRPSADDGYGRARCSRPAGNSRSETPRARRHRFRGPIRSRLRRPSSDGPSR